MDIPVYFLHKKTSTYTDTRRIDLCNKPFLPPPPLGEGFRGFVHTTLCFGFRCIGDHAHRQNQENDKQLFS